METVSKNERTGEIKLFRNIFHLIKFKDQNVLSSNLLESRLDDEPVRYGVLQTEENVDQ